MQNTSDFTFVTYNLDSQSYNFEGRLDAFIHQIKSQTPDVVVVQEGSRLTFEKLLREMGEMKYKRFLPDLAHHRQTGEMIFSKFPIVQNRYIPFKKGSDNRGLSIVQIDIWGRDNVWICTTQVDETVALKREQLHSIPSLIKFIPDKDTVIFGGDTRIKNYQDISCPSKDWLDAWYEAGSENQKYTYDSEINLLAVRPCKDRPDRVWYRTSSIECVECKLFGQESSVTISSHYGVWSKFKFSYL